jgi:hypothetical protein
MEGCILGLASVVRRQISSLIAAVRLGRRGNLHLASTLTQLEQEILIVEGDDVTPGFLRRQAGLVFGVEQIVGHLVHHLADPGDGLRQPLPAGSELLDLGVQPLPALGQVGQHPRPQLLCLLHHGTAFVAGACQRGVGLAPRVLQLGCGFLLRPAAEVGRRCFGLGSVLRRMLLGTYPGPTGFLLRLRPQPLGILLGPSHHVGTGVASSSQDPSGLLAEHRSQGLLVDGRIGRSPLGVGQSLA